jgi:hypothetical protein
MVSKEQLDNWHYEVTQIDMGFKAIAEGLHFYGQDVKEPAQTMIMGFASLMDSTLSRFEKVIDELDGAAVGMGKQGD